MTVKFKPLATGTLSTTASAVYTASGVSAQIDACALTNNSGATATVSLWITAGGAPGNESLILKDYSIAAGVTKRAWEVGGQVVGDGASLYAQASEAGVITLVAGGREQATA